MLRQLTDLWGTKAKNKCCRRHMFMFLTRQVETFWPLWHDRGEESDTNWGDWTVRLDPPRWPPEHKKRRRAKWSINWVGEVPQKNHLDFEDFAGGRKMKWKIKIFYSNLFQFSSSCETLSQDETTSVVFLSDSEWQTCFLNPVGFPFISAGRWWQILLSFKSGS